jgi:DNA-binding transcriptional regulator WhiA
MDYKNTNTAYVTGIAIGDGNLSNSNGRAVKLRVTCDNKYPKLMGRISKSLQELFPENKVSLYVRKENCTDIYVHSNRLENILGWKALEGSKFNQNVRVPSWIFYEKEYMRNCLRGLFETDGSIYKDRKYTYTNFTTIIHGLSQDVQIMIDRLGYSSTTQSSVQKGNKRKFVTRVCKNSIDFIKEVGIKKE